MLGPTGVGVLWGEFDRLSALQPLMLGGGTVERVTASGYTLKRVPYRFEAGTPNIAGIIAFAPALDFVESLGFDVLEAHERALADRLELVLSDLPNAQVLMAKGPHRLALASIVPKATTTVTADHLAVALSDSHQIMVRSGFHCAHLAFDKMQITAGSLRVSCGLYNTLEEVERFGAAVRQLLTRLAV